MNAANTALAETPNTEQTWIDVCPLSDLTPNSGLCALIHQQQIALLYSERLNQVFAIGNYDPIGKANVLSRGIIGSLGESVVVASPLYKQHFDLTTGICLESPEHRVPVYPVRVVNGMVQVSVDSDH